MSPLLTDRPQSPPRSSRVVLAAATWAVGGAAGAAGGWVVGLVLARSLAGVQITARDFLTGQLEDYAVRLAAIGGGWGLLVGLVAGLVRREKQSFINQVAAGSVGAVGGAVFGLIGGGLVPASVAAVGRALPVELSSSLGWAVAGMLAGLVAFGWTQVREKPQPVADEEPDEVAEPVLPPTGEGWPRSLFVAAKWAIGGAVAAIGAWVVGLFVVRAVAGIGPLAQALRTDPAGSAVVLAGFAGASGLLVGATAGTRRGGADRVATGAVGGMMLGLIGGAPCPLAVAVIDPGVPLEVASSVSWAFAGLLAGLVAYSWASVPGGPGRRRRVWDDEA